MSAFIQSLSVGETWIVAGFASLVLWLFIALPLLYRVLFRPVNGISFWGRMRRQPGWGVMLVIMLFALGPVMFYIGIFVLAFAIMMLCFQIFWILILPAPKPASPEE